MKTICFDIDGTICTQTEGDYETAEVVAEALEVINRFYDQGFRIVFYTSRFMGRHEGNAAMARAEGYEFTRRQLERWGFKYHELRMGKPSYDIYVDDKSIFFEQDWQRIAEEIERLSKKSIY